MTEWGISPIFDSLTLVVLIAAVLAIVTLLGAMIGVWRGRTTPRQAIALGGLRLAVILVLLLAMLQVVRSHVTRQPQTATLVVLLDTSRSMLVKDAFNGKSRWQAIVDAVDEAKSALVDPGENLEVRVYTFATQVDALEIADGNLSLPAEPTGQQTAIGLALDTALRQQQGKRLAGVILVSDGAQRAYEELNMPPEQPARRLADMGYPLFTVVVGESRSLGQARDVAVEPNLQVNRTVFVKNVLPVRAEIRVDGFTDERIPVELLFEQPDGQMKVVKTGSISATQNGQRIPVDFEYIPEEPGEYKLTLRAAEQEGELVKTNNERSAYVTVREGGLNVLYLEGEIRPEQRFLRHSLDESPDIQVDYVRIDHRNEKQVDLSRYLTPGKYNVYLLGDLDSDVFRPQDLEALKARVADGAGLMMMGGFHSFGPGGYYATPLADVLPVKLGDATDRQRFEDPDRPDMHIAGPLAMRPASRLLRVPALIRLKDDPRANEKLWSELPPLEGANRFAGVKSGAQVFLETPDGDPLLVAGKYSQGNALAMAGDSTWQWVLQGPGDEGYAREHKRFWRQVILHLAGADDEARGNVWIQLANRELGQGRRLELSAGARTAEGDPVADAVLAAEVVLPDGSTRPLSLSRRRDEQVGWFRDTLQPGDYRVRVKATRGGRPYGEAQARFLVYSQDLELDNAAANPSKMSRLAEMTQAAGGRMIAPEQLASLVEELKEQPPEEIERFTRERLGDHLWDAGPMFLLVIGLLGGEWYLRKKWGMV